MIRAKVFSRVNLAGAHYWIYTVYDTERRAGYQCIVEGTVATRQQALTSACAWIRLKSAQRA